MTSKTLVKCRQALGHRTSTYWQQSLCVAVVLVGVFAPAKSVDAMVELVSYQATVIAVTGLGDDLQQVTGSGFAESLFAPPGADIYASGMLERYFFSDEVSFFFPQLGGPGSFAARILFGVVLLPEIENPKLLSESGFLGSPVAQASAEYALRFRVSQTPAVGIIDGSHEYSLTDTETGELIASIADDDQLLRFEPGEYELKQAVAQNAQLTIGISPVPEPASVFVWGLLVGCGIVSYFVEKRA